MSPFWRHLEASVGHEFLFSGNDPIYAQAINETLY